MKKILIIVTLGLIFCNSSYAIDAEKAKQACLDKGYEAGTEDFTDCALNLVLNLLSFSLRSKMITFSNQSPGYWSGSLLGPPDKFLQICCQ